MTLSERSQPLRVVLVDDEEMYRDIMDITLSMIPSGQLIGTFPNGT